jgi:hypothetical protein
MKEDDTSGARRPETRARRVEEALRMIAEKAQLTK